MALSDHPKIDIAAKSENMSDQRLTQILSMSAGFICRPDIPDYGCDYLAELIFDDQNATNWRFAIQLKSVLNPQFIQDGQILSYAFETSRLGYLLRFVPNMGIIVVYDVNSDRLFYDYADKIYSRLLDERPTDGWKNNDTVNIHIPVTNVLSPEVAKQLHSVFIKRSEQATLMQRSHGVKYDLPSINLGTDQKYDFNNIDDIKTILKKYGILQLSMYDLQFVLRLIESIPNPEIIADKELLLIAAIAYGECGKHTDSNFYIQKLQRRNNVSEDEQQMIQFAKLKNDLALGLISSDEFIAVVASITGRIGDPENEICLEINITFFKLLKVKALHTIPQSLIDSIDNVFSKIDQLKDKSNVRLLELWNLQNFMLLISNIRQKQFSELQIRKSLGEEFTFQEKKDAIVTLMALQKQFMAHLDKINKIANEEKNTLLKAYALMLHSMYVLSQEIDYISFELDHSMRMPDHKDLFRNHVHLSFQSYLKFNELSYYGEAHKCLCYTLELVEISRNYYQYEDPIDLQECYRVKSEMEQAFDLSPYPMVIPSLLARKQNQETETNGSLKFLLLLDENEMENLAHLNIKALKLPKERFPNVLHEMRSYRMFYSRCTDDSLDVLRIRMPGDPENYEYSVPMTFVLKNKKTGIESVPSTDMDTLLTAFGY